MNKCDRDQIRAKIKKTRTRIKAMTLTEMPTTEMSIMIEEKEEEKSIWEKLLGLLF